MCCPSAPQHTGKPEHRLATFPQPADRPVQWKWSDLALHDGVAFPNKSSAVYFGRCRPSLSCHFRSVYSCSEDIVPQLLPPPDLPLLYFPLLLCTSYLRCQESSLTEFIVVILIKLIFLSARLLGSEAGMRFIDFHLEGKVSSFHSHEAIWKIYDRSRRTLARGNDIPVQLKHFQVSFFSSILLPLILENNIQSNFILHCTFLT